MALTDEDKAEIKAMLAEHGEETRKMVNSAVSNRIKETKSKVLPNTQDELDAMIAAAIAKSQESVTTTANAQMPPKEASQLDPAIKGQLQKQEQTIKELLAQNQAREMKIRQQETQSALLAALAAEKIEGTGAIAAMKLMLADGLVKYENDTMSFGDEGVDVGTGVKSWLKTSPLAAHVTPSTVKQGGSGEVAPRKQNAVASPGLSETDVWTAAAAIFGR